MPRTTPNRAVEDEIRNASARDVLCDEIANAIDGSLDQRIQKASLQ